MFMKKKNATLEDVLDQTVIRFRKACGVTRIVRASIKRSIKLLRSSRRYTVAPEKTVNILKKIIKKNPSL